LVPVLFTFYIQDVLKLKNNSGAKRLITVIWKKCWKIRIYETHLRDRVIGMLESEWTRILWNRKTDVEVRLFPLHVILTQNINLLTPNDNYSWRTALLTSKVTFYIFIQQILIPNILNMVYTLLFFSSKYSLFHNSNVFGSSIIHILYTGCAKIKK